MAGTRYITEGGPPFGSFTQQCARYNLVSNKPGHLPSQVNGACPQFSRRRGGFRGVSYDHHRPKKVNSTQTTLPLVTRMFL